MDEKTLTALRGSIAKWEGIVRGDMDDNGPANCPLCQEFIKGECLGCPVADCAEASYCRESPYEEYCAYLDSFSYALEDGAVPRQEEVTRLAQAELDFLRGLLPTEEKQNEQE